MEEATTTSRTCSISLGTIGIITGIVLCILKAVGTITISWFWATFPFWIVPAVSVGLLLILLIIYLCVR